MPERPAIGFSGIIINISSGLELIPVHKSLDTIEDSSITNNLTSDNLFLQATLHFSFKPSKFVPSLIPRPELMVFPGLFTVDISVGPILKSRGLPGSLQ